MKNYINKNQTYVLCNCHTITNTNKIYSDFNIKLNNTPIFFKNICLSCLAIGNKLGEVSHKPYCIFEYCIHSDKYCGISPWWTHNFTLGVIGTKILDKKYKKNNVSYSKDRLTYEDNIPGVLNMNNKWSTHQPNISIRRIHMIFRHNLRDKLQEKITDLDKKLMIKVYEIIEIKTNKKLYLL